MDRGQATAAGARWLKSIAPVSTAPPRLTTSTNGKPPAWLKQAYAATEMKTASKPNNIQDGSSVASRPGC